MINLVNLKDEVIKKVKEASKYMMQNFDIYEKSGISNIVTSSDLSVQNYLYKELSKLINSSGFICEEEDLQIDGSTYEWIIDPIDGTENFSRNIEECSICVALRYNKEIVLGIVYNPFRNQLFHAIKSNGAFLNDKPINVSNREFKKSLICTAMSLYNKDYASKCNDIIMDVYYKCKDFRRFGGAALEICYLAMGQIELFFEIRLFIWDYAAASLILTEAGGVIKGYYDNDLINESVSMVVAANNLENYNILKSIILKHLPSKPY